MELNNSQIRLSVSIACFIICILNLFQISIESKLRSPPGKLVYAYHRILALTSLIFGISHILDISDPSSYQNLFSFILYDISTSLLFSAILFTSYQLNYNNIVAVSIVYSTNDELKSQIFHFAIVGIIFLSLILKWVMILALDNYAYRFIFLLVLGLALFVLVANMWHSLLQILHMFDESKKINKSQSDSVDHFSTFKWYAGLATPLLLSVFAFYIYYSFYYIQDLKQNISFWSYNNDEFNFFDILTVLGYICKTIFAFRMDIVFDNESSRISNSSSLSSRTAISHHSQTRSRDNFILKLKKTNDESIAERKVDLPHIKGLDEIAIDLEARVESLPSRNSEST